MFCGNANAMIVGRLSETEYKRPNSIWIEANKKHQAGQDSLSDLGGYKRVLVARRSITGHRIDIDPMAVVRRVI